MSSNTYAATISFPILLLRFIFFKFWASWIKETTGVRIHIETLKLTTLNKKWKLLPVFSFFFLHNYPFILMESKLILGYLAAKASSDPQRQPKIRNTLIFVAASMSVIPSRGFPNQNMHSQWSRTSNYCDTVQKIKARAHHLPSSDFAGASSHAERRERRNPPPRRMPLEQAGAANRSIPW